MFVDVFNDLSKLHQNNFLGMFPTLLAKYKYIFWAIIEFNLLDLK